MFVFPTASCLVLREILVAGMSTHQRSIEQGSAECSRSEAAVCSEMMFYSCDSTEHLANDNACPKMAPRSRAAIQQRAETLDDDQIRELLELCAKRAHLRKISSRAKAEEETNGKGKEHGVANSAAKVDECSGVKLASTVAYFAASELNSHPSLAHSFAGAVELRAERKQLHKITCRAKAEEECDGMVRVRSMELILRQQKSTGVLKSNSSPLLPAMPLSLSPHILL